MPDEPTSKSTWLSDISRHLGPIFRHTFPGVLLVGGARLAYPERFCRVHLDSWQHVIVLAVIAMAAGNALFAFNRYGLHQFVELLFYAFKVKGPVLKPGNWNFTDDMAEYVIASFERTDTTEIRQHIAFRVSSVLLLLTLAEIALVFSFYRSQGTIFYCHRWGFRIVGAALLTAYLGQLKLARRIDWWLVTNKKPNRKEYPGDDKS